MPAQYISRNQVLVPEEWENTIVQGAIAESAVLRLARRIPMGRMVDHIPVLSALPQAGFVNPRDTGKKPLSFQAWQGITLTAEELACVVPVPQALIDDASFDLWGEVQPRISEAMGAVIDAAALFGTGAPSSWPATGVFGDAYEAGNRWVDGTAAPDGVNDIAEYVNQLMAEVEGDGFDVNGFVSTVSIKSRLRGLRASTSGLLLFQQSLQAGTSDTLYGEPILYSKNGSFDLTKALLFAGDWTMACLGYRQDIRAQVLTEATFTNSDGTVALSLAEQDMVALRVYMRLGFAIANPITRLGTPTRTVTDGVTTSSSTTITSATAAFTSGDVGVGVIGAGIPTNARIASVTNATTAVLTDAATASATGVALTVGGKNSAFAVLEPGGGPA